jgi:hypothetical protein
VVAGAVAADAVLGARRALADRLRWITTCCWLVCGAERGR